jgi:hypothetical protein
LNNFVRVDISAPSREQMQLQAFMFALRVITRGGLHLTAAAL